MDELWFRPVVYWLSSPLYVGRRCWYLIRVPVGLCYEFRARLGSYCQIQGFPWLGLLDSRNYGCSNLNNRVCWTGRGVPDSCGQKAGSGRLRRAGFTVIRTVSSVMSGLISTLVSPSLALGHGPFLVVRSGGVG